MSNRECLTEGAPDGTADSVGGEPPAPDGPVIDARGAIVLEDIGPASGALTGQAENPGPHIGATSGQTAGDAAKIR